jgi:hypothetical protein
MRDVARELHVGVVDPVELVRLITSEFGGASYSGHQKIDIPSSEAPALSVEFTKRGEIATVRTELDEAMISRIADKLAQVLLSPTVTKISRIFAFAYREFDGYLRSENFVLRKAPEDAPRPPGGIGDFPFVVEAGFDATPDALTNIIRADRQHYELLLWLSVIVPGVRIPARTVNFSWAELAHQEGTDIRERKPQWVLDRYSIDSLTRFSDSFTAQGSLPDISKVPTKEYYGRFGADFDAAMDVPTAFDDWQRKFRTLDGLARVKFLRAAFWLQHAVRVQSISQSAALTALIQAIESLLPSYSSGEECHTCKRNVGPGPTKLFGDFVGNFAPPSIGAVDSKRANRDLYNLRSQLTHGKSLMTLDREIRWGWASPLEAQEEMQLDRAYRTARFCAINWLATR